MGTVQADKWQGAVGWSHLHRSKPGQQCLVLVLQSGKGPPFHHPPITYRQNKMPRSCRLTQQFVNALPFFWHVEHVFAILPRRDQPKATGPDPPPAPAQGGSTPTPAARAPETAEGDTFTRCSAARGSWAEGGSGRPRPRPRAVQENVVGASVPMTPQREGGDLPPCCVGSSSGTLPVLPGAVFSLLPAKPTKAPSKRAKLCTNLPVGPHHRRCCG